MSDPVAMPSTPATGAEMSTAETLTGIFFEPSRTFEALRSRPRFLVAGLILLALACVVTAILYTRVDMGQYIRDRIERSPNAAQISEQQKEMQVRIGKMFGMAAIPLSVPIIIAGGAAFVPSGRDGVWRIDYLQEGAVGMDLLVITTVGAGSVYRDSGPVPEIA